MHFCKKCDNMYYIKLDNTEKELIHYCRHCGFEDTQNYLHKNFQYQKYK